MLIGVIFRWSAYFTLFLAQDTCCYYIFAFSWSEPVKNTVDLRDGHFHFKQEHCLQHTIWSLWFIMDMESNDIMKIHQTNPNLYWLSITSLELLVGRAGGHHGLLLLSWLWLVSTVTSNTRKYTHADTARVLLFVLLFQLPLARQTSDKF
jgi:hypothetical protein